MLQWPQASSSSRRAKSSKGKEDRRQQQQQVVLGLQLRNVLAAVQLLPRRQTATCSHSLVRWSTMAAATTAYLLLFQRLVLVPLLSLHLCFQAVQLVVVYLPRSPLHQPPW